MSIYTKMGDSGETMLLFGEMVRKDDQRIETVGEIDELSACLGVCKAEVTDPKYIEIISVIQLELISINGYFVSLDKNGGEKSFVPGDSKIKALEALIDEIQALVPPFESFILYGKTRLSASVDLARAVCRRSERNLYRLDREYNVDSAVKQYVNRLSDFLFIYARLCELA